MITRRHFILALGLWPFAAGAQQGKVWRIGVLETISMTANASNLEAFLKGMLEHGYVERRNFVIDYRSPDGRIERFPNLAGELMRSGVDIIVARGTPATQAARDASKTIPIVATALGDPFVFASSLAHPGGNVTGLSSATTDTAAKRVEILREILPGVTKIAALMNMSNVALPPQWNETERAAKAFGLTAQLFDVRKTQDLSRAFESASKQHVKAVVLGQDGFIQAHAQDIVQLARKHRMPALYPSREYTGAGGLCSFGVSYADLYRRAAAYVDKIIKGTKPGDIPIEQPTKFDLTFNAKTAKELGLRISQSMLMRADKVIE